MTDKIIRTKVVGVSFKNDDGSQRQTNIKQHCKSGDEITFTLGKAPSGAHALAVFVVKNSKTYQIGNLKQELVNDLLSDMAGKNKLFNGRILDVTGGTPDKPSLGVNIEIEVSDVIQSPTHHRHQPPSNSVEPSISKVIWRSIAALSIAIAIFYTLK